MFFRLSKRLHITLQLLDPPIILLILLIFLLGLHFMHFEFVLILLLKYTLKLIINSTLLLHKLHLSFDFCVIVFLHGVFFVSVEDFFGILLFVIFHHFILFGLNVFR